MIRSAGAFAEILGQEGKFVNLKLISGEVRKVLANCLASIGQVSKPRSWFDCNRQSRTIQAYGHKTDCQRQGDESMRPSIWRR